jgi:hypothetical protein
MTKAIQDGGADASVDHSKGWMQSKETGDIYLTQVRRFHKCCSGWGVFCWNVVILNDLQIRNIIGC